MIYMSNLLHGSRDMVFGEHLTPYNLISIKKAPFFLEATKYQSQHPEPIHQLADDGKHYMKKFAFLRNCKLQYGLWEIPYRIGPLYSYN